MTRGELEVFEAEYVQEGAGRLISRPVWKAVAGSLLCAGVLVFGWSLKAFASDHQSEFGKRQRYDATQCVEVIDEQMVQNKRKFLAVFAENKCSRTIQALACFDVTRPSLKHSRTGWYCNLQEYKARSRQMISDHATYGRVKKWAACNPESESCIRLLGQIEGNVNSSGQDPEAVGRRLR